MSKKKSSKDGSAKRTFPAPNCTNGYSKDYLEELLDEETFAAFNQWHYGQTGSICDGTKYNHSTKQYGPSECADTPHGFICYTWDVHRFLGIIEGKEIWD